MKDNFSEERHNSSTRIVLSNSRPLIESTAVTAVCFLFCFVLFLLLLFFFLAGKTLNVRPENRESDK